MNTAPTPNSAVKSRTMIEIVTSAADLGGLAGGG
jgi:hypothetical protein